MAFVPKFAAAAVAVGKQKAFPTGAGHVDLDQVAGFQVNAWV